MLVLNCWNFLSRKIQRSIAVLEVSRLLQLVWKEKLWKKTWKMVVRGSLQAISFQQNLQDKPVVCGEEFIYTFLTNLVKQISVLTFCGCLRNSGEQKPVLTMFCHPTQKKKILPPHSRKIVCNFSFEKIWTFTLIGNKFSWLWYWN